MFGFFLHGQTGSDESRLHAFAGRRICRIATVLGEEEARRAIEQAEEEYGKSMDPRAWNVCKNGTPEEREAFQAEVLRSFDDCQDIPGEDDPQTAAE